MNPQNHPQQDDFQKLDFTLWRLQREHEMRHQHEVNRALNERPRDRAVGAH